MMKPFNIVPFSKELGKKEFFCGSLQLDAYWFQQASQDVKRRIASFLFFLMKKLKLLFFTQYQQGAFI